MKLSSRARRPFLVTLLAFLVLSVAVTNLVRLVQAAQQAAFLAQVLLVPPLYLMLSGLIWALCGVVLAAGLWLGKSWARPFFWLFFAAYSLYFWLDRLVLPGYAERNFNWPFLAGLNLALTVVCFLIFSRRSARAFFGEMHER